MNVISKQTRRRYILGRQGLWPGRRWMGLAGVAQVAVGYAELDTLSNALGRDQIQTDFFRLGASASVDLNRGTTGLHAHLDTAFGAAFGSNKAVMNVVVPGIGLNGLQAGEADFDPVVE